MVLIEEGDYWIGNTGEEFESPEDEFPYHKVHLDAYLIGKYETTREEYRQFMEDNGYHEPQYWSKLGWEWKAWARETPQPAHWEVPPSWIATPWPESGPVVYLSYYEAQAYCAWYSEETNEHYRLPTEAEWEVAARWDPIAKSVTQYPWGDGWDIWRLNCNEDGASFPNLIMPVGSYPEGVSHFGAYDMAGNAAEWVRDMYDPKFYSMGMTWETIPSDEARNNPFNRLAKYSNEHVYRGGDMFSTQNGGRSAKRDHTWAGNNGIIGFRIARNPYPTATWTPIDYSQITPREMVYIPAGRIGATCSPTTESVVVKSRLALAITFPLVWSKRLL